MSDNNQKHHHHHHHHYEDDSDRFKRDSLNSIRYRKLVAKWGYRLLLIVAAIMAIAVAVVYTLK